MPLTLIIKPKNSFIVGEDRRVVTSAVVSVAAANIYSAGTMLVCSYALSEEVASAVIMLSSVLQMGKLKFFPKILSNFSQITQIMNIDLCFQNRLPSCKSHFWTVYFCISTESTLPF